MKNKNFLVFIAGCLGMLFFGIALLSMGSLLPSIVSRFNMDSLAAGSLISLLPFGVLAGSMTFGPIVDRFGYKLMLIVCSIIVIGGLLGLANAVAFFVLQCSIFFIGFGGGMLNGATNALVADISAGERGAKLSLLGVFFGVGALGMPVLLGSLSALSYQQILTGICVVLFLPVIYFLIIRFPVPKQTQGFPLKEGAKLLHERSLILIALALAFQSGLEGVVNNWTTTFLQQARATGAQESLFALSVFVAAMTITRLALGGLLKKLNNEFVLWIGITLSCFGVLVLMLTTGSAGIIVGLILLGIGLAAGFPLLLGYVADMYPTISGTAFSIVFVIALLGNMAINYSVGVIAQWYGIKYYTFCLGSCFFVQIGLLSVALRSYKQKMAQHN